MLQVILFGHRENINRVFTHLAMFLQYTSVKDFDYNYLSYQTLYRDPSL